MTTVFSGTTAITGIGLTLCGVMTLCCGIGGQPGSGTPLALAFSRRLRSLGAVICLTNGNLLALGGLLFHAGVSVVRSMRACVPLYYYSLKKGEKYCGVRNLCVLFPDLCPRLVCQSFLPGLLPFNGGRLGGEVERHTGRGYEGKGNNTHRNFYFPPGGV